MGRNHDHERRDRRDVDSGFQEVDPDAWDNVRDALIDRDKREAERESRRQARRAAQRRRRAEKLRRTDEEDDQ